MSTPSFRANGVKFPDGSNSPTVWNVKDPAYGAKGDGVTDDTTAIQAAVTACEAANGGTVYFPVGTYIVTGTITMHRGTILMGVNGPSDTIGYGSTIKHKVSSVNLFVWDGNGATSAAGYGGGAQDLFIAKAIGFTGGDAMYVVGTDDNHRPGEMVFSNVVIGAENNAALWSRGLHVDGSANVTSGSRGVRSIRLDKFRVSGADGTGFPNKAIHLTQVTHFFASHLEIDPVGGDGSVGMTIDGNSDQVYISSMEINGSLVIANPSDGTYNPNYFITGRCSVAFTSNSALAVGEATVTTAAVTNASPSFNVDNVGVAATRSGSWQNTGASTVRDTSSPINGSVFQVLFDDWATQLLGITDNATQVIRSAMADGASAIATKISTLTAWSNAAARLLSLQNNGVEKAYVLQDGTATFNGITGSAGAYTFGSQPTLPAGTGTATGTVPVSLYRDTTVTPSVTTGETAGSTFSIPANTLSANGQQVWLRAAWTHAANANATTAKLYLNGSALVTLSPAASGDTILTEIKLVRTSATVVTYGGYSIVGASFVAHRGTFTIAAGSIMDTHISVTGATTNGDLSTNYLRVEWWP